MTVPCPFPSRQGPCLPPASLLIEYLPLHLLHFGKSFSFCVFTSPHLMPWEISSGFTTKVGSMGEVSITSSYFCTVSWRATPVPRVWDPSCCSGLESTAGSPTTSPSYIAISTLQLWRRTFACLDNCTPSPLAPTGAAGSWLCSRTSWDTLVACLH